MNFINGPFKNKVRQGHRPVIIVAHEKGEQHPIEAKRRDG